MTREEMFTKVINKFGFEGAETIRFANLIEKGTDEEIRVAYENMMRRRVCWTY